MSETYVECLVKQKTGGIKVFFKVLLIMLTVAFAVFGLLSYSSMLLLGALIFGIGIYFVNRYTNLEYEYLYLDKELTIDKVMNKSKRKRIGVFEIDRMEILAPIKSHQLDSYRSRQVKTLDYSIGEELQPDRRYVMYYNGEKRMILSPSAEILKAIHNVAPRKVFSD